MRRACTAGVRAGRHALAFSAHQFVREMCAFIAALFLLPPTGTKSPATLFQLGMPGVDSSSERRQSMTPRFQQSAARRNVVRSRLATASADRTSNEVRDARSFAEIHSASPEDKASPSASQLEPDEFYPVADQISPVADRTSPVTDRINLPSERAPVTPYDIDVPRERIDARRDDR